ncbi:unnamed protein product [Heterobilharzia americana]|nr:unnamed protein product [Heterobilharzia americana]
MSSPILDINKANNIETCNQETALKSDKSQFEGKSLIIEYPGYRILIIDTGLIERHRKQDILSTIDIIIVLQWNSKVQSSLNSLFNEENNGQLQFKKFTCLILPAIDTVSHVKFNSMHNKPMKSSLAKDDGKKRIKWIRSALKLGLTILQVSNGSRFWTRFQHSQPINNIATNSHVSSIGNEKIHLTIFNYPTSKTTYTTEMQKRSLLLFEKFGVGKLKMLPVHAGCVGSSYSILLIWLPYECEQSALNEPKKSTTKVFFYPATLELKTDELSEQKSETDRQQLTRFAGVNCPISRKGYSDRDPSNTQTGITRSKTFTSGLNPSTSKSCTNGIPSVTNPILRKSCEQKNEDGLSKSSIDSRRKENGIKQVKFGPIEECQYKGGKKVTMKASSNESHTSAATTVTTTINSTTTTTTSIANTTNTTTTTSATDSSGDPSPVQNNQVNSELFLEPSEHSNENKEHLLIKSTSFPNQLAEHTMNHQNRPTSLYPQCSDYQYYYYCNDQKCEQFPLSATVLLAIPEVGENDYYADSPQCLTVKELKELGLYNSEEDEDDDADEDNNDEDCGNEEEAAIMNRQRIFELENTLPDDRTNNPSFISETDIIVPHKNAPDLTEIHVPQNISLTRHEEVMIQ